MIPNAYNEACYVLETQLHDLQGKNYSCTIHIVYREENSCKLKENSSFYVRRYRAVDERLIQSTNTDKVLRKLYLRHSGFDKFVSSYI